MNLEVSHNPEIILEYFKTLKEWNKDKFNLDISSEMVQMDEHLVLLRENLDRVRLSITDKSDSIKSINNEIDEVNQNITSTEKEIAELRNRIRIAQSEHLDINNKIKSIEAFERPSNGFDESVSRSKSSGKLRLIFAIIRNDIEIIYLDFKKAVSDFNVQILLQYLIGFSIGLILLINLSFLAARLISLMLLALYLLWRTRSIFKLKGQRSNSQGKQIRTYQDTNVSDIRYRQQDLETNIGKLQSQLNHHEKIVNQYRRNQKDSFIKIDQININILNLNSFLNQGVETYQKTAESIVEQIRVEKMDRLSHLEVLFQRWLKEYIAALTENARRKLGLVGIEFDDDPMALKAKPITVWVGVTKETSPSLIVQDSLTEETVSDEISKLHIDPEEFESQAAYEGSKRKYGVYEFLVIFLCEDFLSYYRCYFNFIRRQTVNEEYREYLYKNIVFTKFQEKSSVKTKDYDSKQVHSKSLTISTNDGKTLCFQIPKSRGESNPSELDRAARTIRNLLRQCRRDDSD